jgi:DNA-binding beta-propeller fold protein YncE
LPLTLATGVASLLAAVPAQAADIYTVTAKIGIGVGPYPDSVAVSPDGTRAYVTENTYGGPVWVINTAKRRIIYVIGLCHPTGVAVCPNGTHIYVADFQYSGNLAVITRESVVTHR